MKLSSSRLLFLFLIVLLNFGCKRAIHSEKHTSFQKESSPNIENVFSPEIQKSNKSSNSQSLILTSWNIQHLGRTKTPEDLHEIANILRNSDIVAIQEVVAIHPGGAQAVAKIADELNRMGFKWNYQVSDPTKSPSSNISERYAFLWKPSRVKMVHRAYLDEELEELCYREPFITKFQAKGGSEQFYVINYHSRKHNDRPEEEIIHFIDYPDRFGSEKILIAGDFNLNEKHAVWRPFYRMGLRNALKNQRTTLKRGCSKGDYLSRPIDNIYFMPGITLINSGTLDFVKNCVNIERARKISDHLPVYMEFKIEDDI